MPVNEPVKRYDITGLGHAITDMIAETSDAVPADLGLAKGAMTLLESAQEAEKILAALGGAQACENAAGGSAGNTVAALAALGRGCTFIGNVAGDDTGKAFVRDFYRQGIAFSRGGPAPEEDVSGRCCICVTPDGERTMATYLGASRALDAEHIDISFARSSRIVYAEAYLWDGENISAVIEHVFAEARDAGGKTAFSLSDPFCVERHHEQFRALIEAGKIDYLFGNEEETARLFPAENKEELAAYFKDNVALAFITHGAAGATVYAQGSYSDVPAEEGATVKDTTGAGDLFAAGALHGILAGAAPEACAALGCRAAAHIIARTGGRTGEGFAEEMEEAVTRAA